MHGKLSAKDVCILSYWARGAGVQGKAASLAVKPSRTGGGFSEKFDVVLGLTEAIQGDFCEVPVPGMRRSALDRPMVPCHGAYVYEDLAKEIAETPGFEKRLRDQVLAGDLGPQYEKNVVQAQPAGQFAVPLALYVDGVPFQRRDSVTGSWLVNLPTGRRHVFFTVRKKDMCRCGCKGWCSQYAIRTYTRWLVDAIHTGRYPRQRHTMEPWRVTDSECWQGLTWDSPTPWSKGPG